MKRVITVLALVPVLALAACGGGDEPDAAPASAATATPSAEPTPAAAKEGGATTKVAIEGFAFSPRAVKVKVGEKISWTNDDAAPHTVTAKSGGDMDSGTMAQGASFSFTASEPGTIEYFCTIHPSMVGTIDVS